MDAIKTTFLIYSWFACLVTALGLGYVAYYVLSAPFRRIDCANLVVELNELAAATGKDSADLFHQLGGVRDVPYGGKFRRLAGLMESGRSFIESLKVFHSLLPGEVFGTMELARNERSHHLLAKLSRAHLEDGVSQAQNSYKLFSASFIILIPTTLAIGIGAINFIIPKFQAAVLSGMIGSRGLPAMVEFLFRLYDTLKSSGLTMVIPTLLILIVAALAVANIYGFSAPHDTKSFFNRLFSQIAWLMPWRRNRLKRNFVWIFCEMIDNGVTEAEALKAAAAASKNSVLQRRADLAVKDLQNGQPLATAMRRFDTRADLAWRVKNASHGGTTFREALEGWTDHLSALAYKQHQAAFYYAFTAMTIFNGLCVLCIGLFFLMPLATMIEAFSMS